MIVLIIELKLFIVKLSLLVVVVEKFWNFRDFFFYFVLSFVINLDFLKVDVIVCLRCFLVWVDSYVCVFFSFFIKDVFIVMILD